MTFSDPTPGMKTPNHELVKALAVIVLSFGTLWILLEFFEPELDKCCHIMGGSELCWNSNLISLEDECVTPIQRK